MNKIMAENLIKLILEVIQEETNADAKMAIARRRRPSINQPTSLRRKERY